MIKAEHVTKKFGNRTACLNISFEVFPGEPVALLGPNGAGKTTILKMLSGCLLPTEGTITVQGFDTARLPLEARQSTGCVFDNMPLYEHLTVAGHLSFIAAMYGIRGNAIGAAVSAVIGSCNLAEARDRLIRGLSKGFRARICLAQALIHNPPVLVLDEPTNGLDPLQLDEFRSLMHALAGNKTILLSTHSMLEVESLCARVLLIDQGTLIEQGTAAEICRRTKTANIEKAFLALVGKEERKTRR